MQKESSEDAGSNNPNPNTLSVPGHNHHRQTASSSRIHFPAESQNTRTHRSLKSVAESGWKVGSPKDGTGSISRRRVVSVDAGNGTLKSNASKRVPTVSLGSSAQVATPLHSTENKDSDWGLSTFSEEYDLAHEGECSIQNPRILQDVQRALKLKYRREARARSPLHSGPSPSPPSSPPKFTFPIPSSPRSTSNPNVVKTSVTDIDFSPSTGPASHKVVAHPVPFSTDDGDTLDWSSYLSDDDRSEKRWSLSVTKRKGKEREAIVSADDLKRQEGIHASKLKRIKTVSSPLTAKKVAITIDQLSRRYNLIYSSLSTGSDRFNLLKVSRWYGEQDVLIRSSLQKAEPFPWLKHLDRRSRKQSGDENVRMPWHLSALIMEEYLHAQNARNRAMLSIPEHPSVSDSLGDLKSPFLISPVQDDGPSLPTFPSPSRNSSARLSLSRHISAEGRVSFEPLLLPPQTRPSNESRRSVESTFSSIFSGSSAQNQKDRDRSIGISSPASSRLYLKEGLGLRRKWANESDDGSSARNSPAEQSDDREEKSDQGDHLHKRSSWRFGNGTGGGAIETSPGTNKEGEESFVHVDEIDISFDKPTPLPLPETAFPILNPAGAQHNAPRIINRNIRPINISLPSEDRIAFALEQKRREEADEARADMEYDLKAQLVAQCKDSNTHIRSVLNRIAQHIREYETCQSSFVSNTLGLKYQGGLPQDLLEAFSHDPANVTSSTRRMKTYRAVDDIHQRLTRQRALFREFLEQNGGGRDGFPVTEDILKEPIASLIDSLKELKEQRMGIVRREQEVSEVLRQTQVVHAEAKKEYNSALAHTSVVYPELTQIVGLQESYKDQYQHLWDIGMDALTFILDSITPFWRNYGRVIGDDVQAFLIIPLYRNEFTGEAKRYPITRFPRRSFQHWIALLLFFILTIVVMFFQARTALSSSVHFRLRWITVDGLRWIVLPFFWGGIVIQWLAVLGELAILMMQVGTLMWWVGWSVRLVS